jgi:hypothetical protein
LEGFARTLGDSLERVLTEHPEVFRLNRAE